MISMETAVDGEAIEYRQKKASRNAYMAGAVGLILVVLVAGSAMSLHSNKEVVSQRNAAELKGFRFSYSLFFPDDLFVYNELFRFCFVSFLWFFFS